MYMHQREPNIETTFSDRRRLAGVALRILTRKYNKNRGSKEVTMRQRRAQHSKHRCTNTRWDDRARRFRNLQTAPAARRRRLVAEQIDRPASAGRAGPRASPHRYAQARSKRLPKGGSENTLKMSRSCSRTPDPRRTTS